MRKILIYKTLCETMRKILIYKTLWWILPILNYLFCMILDLINPLSHTSVVERPPIYQNIYIIGYIMLAIWLYLYLWICSSRDFNKQAVLIITILSVFFQTLIHFGVIAFVTTTTYDLYICDNNAFPIGEFIYSILYFMPFYVVAFVLRGKLFQIKLK